MFCVTRGSDGIGVKDIHSISKISYCFLSFIGTALVLIAKLVECCFKLRIGVWGHAQISKPLSIPLILWDVSVSICERMEACGTKLSHIPAYFYVFDAYPGTTKA